MNFLQVFKITCYVVVSALVLLAVICLLSVGLGFLLGLLEP